MANLKKQPSAPYTARARVARNCDPLGFPFAPRGFAVISLRLSRAGRRGCQLV
jgi:hypothetical protein